MSQANNLERVKIKLELERLELSYWEWLRDNRDAVSGIPTDKLIQCQELHRVAKQKLVVRLAELDVEDAEAKPVRKKVGK